MKIVKPGVMYRDIGKPISRIAKKNKFSVVKSYCGHGIGTFILLLFVSWFVLILIDCALAPYVHTGTLFHCAPNIPHYANNKGVGIMREGHVFTIEPMVSGAQQLRHTRCSTAFVHYTTDQCWYVEGSSVA